MDAPPDPERPRVVEYARPDASPLGRLGRADVLLTRIAIGLLVVILVAFGWMILRE